VIWAAVWWQWCLYCHLFWFNYGRAI